MVHVARFLNAVARTKFVCVMLSKRVVKVVMHTLQAYEQASLLNKEIRSEHLILTNLVVLNYSNIHLLEGLSNLLLKHRLSGPSYTSKLLSIFVSVYGNIEYIALL